MAVKSGMGGSRPTKSKNPEELANEHILMMSKGLDAISEKEISGEKKKSDSKKIKAEIQHKERKGTSEALVGTDTNYIYNK